jgi:hypothetical protein
MLLTPQDGGFGLSKAAKCWRIRVFLEEDAQEIALKSMIPEKLVPDAIRDGHRFSDRITLG